MKVARDENGIAHIVFLSGGKDSTALAFRLKEIEPRPYMYVCTPTGDELPEMFAHWRYVSERLGAPIIPIMAETGLKGICEAEGMLPNRRARFCTRKLKLKPAALFLGASAPCVSYVGLRADEDMREGAQHGGDYLPKNFEGVIQDYPFQRWGWSLKNVLAYLDLIKINVPDRTDCARCFYQTIGEWFKLWRDHLEIFLDAEKQEQDLGHSFRMPVFKDGKPVLSTMAGHTFQACHRDSWPAFLADMRILFERGLAPKHANQIDMFRRNMCRTCTL